MDPILLRNFVAVAEELHFIRAANSLNISRMKLDSSIAKLEYKLGVTLFEPNAAATTLTKAGVAFLVEAKAELLITPAPKKAPNTGGKAKASKGTGRTPAVKGQPKPFKKRQSR